MKWFIIPIVLMLNGCAYTAVSTATYVTTGKSIGDHTASLATGNDCDTTRYVLGRQDYWCEQARDVGTTYNRNPY
jgi:hypothetical protein